MIPLPFVALIVLAMCLAIVALEAVDVWEGKQR